MGSLTPCLRAEMSADVWQEHGRLHGERPPPALYQFGVSAVKYLSPGHHYGLDVSGGGGLLGEAPTSSPPFTKESPVLSFLGWGVFPAPGLHTAPSRFSLSFFLFFCS